MKCPYNRLSIQSVSTSSNEYEEETEILKLNKAQYYETYTLMDCLQDKCAAWQNERCVRTG